MCIAKIFEITLLGWNLNIMCMVNKNFILGLIYYNNNISIIRETNTSLPAFENIHLVMTSVSRVSVVLSAVSNQRHPIGRVMPPVWYRWTSDTTSLIWQRRRDHNLILKKLRWSLSDDFGWHAEQLLENCVIENIIVGIPVSAMHWCRCGSDGQWCCITMCCWECSHPGNNF